MITLDITLSGTQLGNALRSDAEELWYALIALTDDSDPERFREFAQEVGYYVGLPGERERVVERLRILLAEIEDQG